MNITVGHNRIIRISTSSIQGHRFWLWIYFVGFTEAWLNIVSWIIVPKSWILPLCSQFREVKMWDLFGCYLISIRDVLGLSWYYTCSLNLSHRLRIKRQISNFKFLMSVNRIVTKVFLMTVYAIVTRINVSGRLMKLLLRIHHTLIFIHYLANWSRWFWVTHVLQLFDVIYLVRWQ